jgi:hypothetical protein
MGKSGGAPLVKSQAAPTWSPEPVRVRVRESEVAKSPNLAPVPEQLLARRAAHVGTALSPTR